MHDPTELADRYVAFWNEPDPDRRRAATEALWTEDAVHTLQPPEEVVAIASRPGIGLTARLEARGHAELVARATSAHDEFIAGNGCSFRHRGDARRVADVVSFSWEMLSPEGEPIGGGNEFIVTAPDGRILRDIQFVG
jgi:hypothetical protein